MMDDRWNSEFCEEREPLKQEEIPDEDLFDQEIPSTDKKNPKNSRKHSGRKKAGFAARAAAFGLIAGTVFYGTNSVISHTFVTEESSESASAASDSDGNSQSLLSNSDSGTVSTTETTSGGTVADVAASALPSLVTISCTTVEEMQDLYEYFGNNGMNGMEDLYGSSGTWSGSGTSETEEVSSQGTGVIIGQNEEELLIATNNHVVSGADSLSVGFVDETAVSAEIKGTDSSTDLAVVSVKIADIPQDTLDQIAIAAIGDSDSLVLGEQVVAIGNALGYGQSVTSGYISAFDRDLTLTDDQGETFESTGLIQTDASINSGNSGGGLFNMKGELIAINEAKTSSSSGSASVDNVGFAIPMEKALPILQSLMNGESTEDSSSDSSSASGYIGISCTDVSETASEMYGLPVGVSIVNVEDSSPAAEAGLKTGDIITDFNGTSITTYEELKSALAQYSAGDTVTITVSRSSDGEYASQQITLTLGSASDAEPTSQGAVQ